MRKTKITKKSGTIAYQLNPRYDLQGEATEKNPLMGVSVVSSTPVTTKEMAERRLRAFFEDHEYIYRSQMEQLCECSTYLATKYLNLFVKEGRLRALGRQNSRFYAPHPEGF